MLNISLFRRVGLALMGAAVIYGEPPVGVGYLPRIGPSPIRFRSVTVRNAADVLPPLRMTDEAASTSDDALKATDDSAKDSENRVSEQFETFGPAVPPDFSWPTGTNDSQEGFPQMLMHYFKGATNSHVIITTPVEFTPPSPPTRSSSATYISK